MQRVCLDGMLASRYFYSLLIGLAVAGVIIVLVSTGRYGPGLSPDSIGYLSAAENLNRGEGFMLFSGEPMTVWPPLFPSILAVIDRTWLGAARGIRVLHALIFGWIVYLCGLLFSRHVRDRRLALLGSAAVALSVPLLDSMVMVWSEPLFTLLILLGALGMERYVREPQRRHLATMAICLALACLQRYSGLGILAAFTVGIVLLPSQLHVRSRVVRASVVIVCAIVPLAVWIFRNLAADGTAMGPRVLREWTIMGNLATAADFFSAWFLPSIVPVVARLGLLAAAGITAIVVLNRKRLDRLRKPAIFNPFIWFGLFLAVFYAGFLIFTTAGVKVDPVSSRMLAPVYPFAVLTLLVVADAVLNTFIVRRWKQMSVAIMSLWLLYPFAWTTHRMQTWISDGIGYASHRYQDPLLTDWLRDVTLPAGSITNDPEAVYHMSRTWMPPVPLRTEITNKIAPGGYLVWFKDYVRKESASPHELAARYRIVPVLGFDAAFVYRMDKL